MIDWFKCCLYLVPGAQLGCGATYESIVWSPANTQPKPTQAQCEAAWPNVQAQEAADAQAAVTAKANEATIGDTLLAALQSNQLAIASLTAWRTTGAGAGTANLTLAQVSPVLRQMADNQTATLRQVNGLIRLIKRQLSTADLSSAVKT